MLSSCAAETEIDGTSFLVGLLDLFISVLYSIRSIKTDISLVIECCDEEYIPFPDIEYKNEAKNPKTTVVSLYTTIDMCNRFRDSLKPVFKLLPKKMNEINIELEDINYKFESCTSKEEVKNYINKNQLMREDVNDFIAKVDNGKVILEPDDGTINGLIVFKCYQKKKKILLGGIEPPFRDSESHVITTTLQEIMFL